MTKRNKLGILINPPIYDTQYWARWSMPHGLLKIATWLRNEGYDLKLFDCLNVYGKESGVPEKTVDFESYDAVRKQKKSVVVLGTNIEKSIGTEDSIDESTVKPSYKLKPNEKWKYVFGMPIGDLEKHLFELKEEIKYKQYDSVEFWITSIMTYWWESTDDVIKLALQVFPGAKIRVGGIYPTLAHEHAKTKLTMSPIEVIDGEKLDLDNEEQMSKNLIVRKEIFQASDLDLATDLYEDDERPPYTILTTSRGCPHICSYCASNELNGGTKVRNRPFDKVISEIKEKFVNGTRVFCFYEDNLLMKMKEFKSILKAVLSDKTLYGIKIFAPEGIEIGVALSDRKRFLLKLKSNKSILATLSVEVEDGGDVDSLSLYDEFKGAKNRGNQKTFIKLEEDLTQGAVKEIEQTDDLIKLKVAGEEEVVLRKIHKDSGRHELVFENEDKSNMGLYLVAVPEIVYLMKLAGFEKIYLPLETIKKETNARWNRSWNSNLQRFEALLGALEEVGFDTRRQNVNAFVMFGLPGEDLEEVYDTALYASERVGSVIPMLFTPVPSTKVFEEYQDYINKKGFDLQHLNGKLFPFFDMLKEQMMAKHDDFKLEISDYVRVESFMQRVNSKVQGKSVNIYGDTKVSRIFRKSFSEYRSIMDDLMINNREYKLNDLEQAERQVASTNE